VLEYRLAGRDEFLVSIGCVQAAYIREVLQVSAAWGFWLTLTKTEASRSSVSVYPDTGPAEPPPGGTP